MILVLSQGLGYLFTGVKALRTEYLVSFCEVVESGSFTVAAQRLFLSQPTVSQHIKWLEKHFQIRLFSRDNGPPVLTPEGQAIFFLAKKLLHEEEQLMQRVKQIRDQLDTVTISVGLSTGTYVLAPLIAKFHKMYPNCRLMLKSSDWRKCMNEVLDGKADFGITFDYCLRPNLDIDCWWDDHFVCVAPPHDVDGIQEKLATRDFAQVGFILPPKPYPTRMFLEHRFREADIPLNVAFETWSPDGIKQAVREGLGLGLLLSRTANAGSLPIVPIQGVDLSCRLVLFHNTKNPFTPSTNAFHKFIKSQRSQSLIR